MDHAPLTGLREATDADADGLADLIGGVYAEYPGCVLDLPGIDADLTAIRTSLGATGGRMWVVERDGHVVACVGYAPTTVDGRPAIELKRLYVARDHRRQGLGSALTGLVTDTAAVIDVPFVELWSDTRFTDAHRRYESLGWVRFPETRDLHDPSSSTEYRYLKPMPAAPRPDRRITWHGFDGRVEQVEVRANEHHVRLAGTVVTVEPAGRWDYEVVLDGGWRTRFASVDGDGVRVRTITSDGRGAWWVDGQHRHDLDGCVDVDLGLSPATNTLPLRRGVAGTLRMAWLRFPELDVVPAEQTYTQLTDTTWRYASGTFAADLLVDPEGFVVTYGDGLWQAH